MVAYSLSFQSVMPLD